MLGSIRTLDKHKGPVVCIVFTNRTGKNHGVDQQRTETYAVIKQDQDSWASVDYYDDYTAAEQRAIQATQSPDEYKEYDENPEVLL